MRTIEDHQVSPADKAMTITVLDVPGSGNANHRYQVSNSPAPGEPVVHVYIPFQEGPIAKAGINGLTNEVLLAIVADRLRGFQSGEYACKANDRALTHIEEAQHWLQQRTIERMRRGVEGTHAV